MGNTYLLYINANTKDNHLLRSAWNALLLLTEFFFFLTFVSKSYVPERLKCSELARRPGYFV